MVSAAGDDGPCDLEKAISSKEHKAKAEALALDPQIIKGEDYRNFLKDNEQATKKLMGW